MADTDGQTTGTATPGAAAPAADTKGDEGVFKRRLARAIEKREPEWIEKGKQSLLDELGIDADDLGSVKDLLSKRDDIKTQEQRSKREMDKIARERDEARAELQRFRLERDAGMVRDAIAGAIGDAGIVPGTSAQIVKLLSDRFRVEDGKVLTLGDDGEPVNVSAKKVVETFLSGDGKHFLAATAPQGGAGSRPGGGSNGRGAEYSVDAARAAFDGLAASGALTKG